ncbi:MAG TPA: HAMP domain-containing sensor histidine kinase [Candidatus Paceibacterota bacterium]|nr:HAMP domain-containing sensor histidine kinase [Candidatus Paceibacterota bacterium]
MERIDYTRHIYGFVVVATILVTLGALSLWGIARARITRETIRQSLVTEHVEPDASMMRAIDDEERFERNLLAGIGCIMLGGMLLAVDLGVSIAANQRKSDEFREQLIGLASHQLKTPITVYRWSLDALKDAGPLTAAQSDVMRQMTDNAVQMGRVVNDLLDLSRIDQGRFLMKPEPLALDSLLRDIVGRLTPIARERNLELKTEIGDGPFPARLDKVRIGQAIGNTLENAIKYAFERTAVHVGLHRRDGSAVITVANNGPGIPVHEQNRLFQRFFRASTAIKPGTGLGLYIVKAIVDQSGGSVSFVSVPDKETEFRITLPLS